MSMPQKRFYPQRSYGGYGNQYRSYRAYGYGGASRVRVGRKESPDVRCWGNCWFCPGIECYRSRLTIWYRMLLFSTNYVYSSVPRPGFRPSRFGGGYYKRRTY